MKLEPSRSNLQAAIQVVQDLILVCRYEYLTYSLGLPCCLLGLMPEPPSGMRVLAVLGLALSFHLFGALTNEVFDLNFDRRASQRTYSPLVRGTLSPASVLLAALLQVPIQFRLLFQLGANQSASLALVISLLLMALYNVCTKRTRHPLLLDLILGFACGGFCLSCVLLCGEPKLPMLLLILAEVVWMTQINLMGTVRDLVDEQRTEAFTGAMALGVFVMDDGRLVITPAFRRYAMVSQALLCFCFLGAISLGWAGAFHPVHTTVLLGTVLFCAFSTATLHSALIHSTSARVFMRRYRRHFVATICISVLLLAPPVLYQRLDTIYLTLMTAIFAAGFALSLFDHPLRSLLPTTAPAHRRLTSRVHL